MELSATTVAILLTIGVLALGAATSVAVRQPATASDRRVSRLAPLVPWLGSGVVVLLLVRGAIAGAVVVGLATLAHAGVARWRAGMSGR